MAACALVGAGAGYGLTQLVKLTGLHVKTLSWFDVISLSLGLGFVAMGVVSAIAASNRRRLARVLESAGDSLFLAEAADPNPPATDAEVRTALTQAAVLGLTGVLMLVPIFCLAPVAAHPGLGRWIFPGIFAAFLGQSALNLQLWLSSDEFVRKLFLSVCAASFVAFQGLLFLWAAAERLQLVPAATSWQIFTLMMAGYMAIGFWISARQRR